jgi:hypothetical protein
MIAVRLKHSRLNSSKELSMKLDVKLEIAPYQGIADIHFGMTAARIRSLLAAEPITFRKMPADEPIDDYTELGLQIHYTAAGGCAAIELAAPANPTFKGQTLIGRPFNELGDWLQAIDHTLEIDQTGLTAPTLGFGLYAPFAGSDPNAPVEAVIVFAPNYYQ